LEAIKEGQNRVKSIALIHQQLYQTEDLSQVDFQEYCEQLVSFLQSAFGQSSKAIATWVNNQRVGNQCIQVCLSKTRFRPHSD
tara:strand:+ start:614 stop:862 length:249 start_codon:yes stop_codon:yes gene_type:complete